MGHALKVARKVGKPLYWDRFGVEKMYDCFAWVGYSFWDSLEKEMLFGAYDRNLSS